MTLERFLNARNYNVEAAAEMCTTTIAWQARKNLNVLMDTHGTVKGLYNTEGSRVTSASKWNWARFLDKNMPASLIQ
ncbi:hypothetical protein TrLO_g3909 [Triparma laevis f. longispina]|uniref:Uncharacterized protein n=1 Tax=Triparma laevis f. longispina TaxID=1714387 RepID=A0A9W7FSS1_9STRA|nr:hypothetical protein TrLO_g3909 [Triparma laevis f. longispina]